MLIDFMDENLPPRGKLRELVCRVDKGSLNRFDDSLTFRIGSCPAILSTASRDELLSDLLAPCRAA